MLHDHIGDFIAFEGSEYDDREKRQACGDRRASPDDRMVPGAVTWNMSKRTGTSAVSSGHRSLGQTVLMIDT
jgi:hypothetical protein